MFDSVSRMSRNAEEGFALYEDLYHKGIRLVFLKEHHIDTETYKKALSGSIAMTGTNVDFILKLSLIHIYPQISCGSAPPYERH